MAVTEKMKAFIDHILKQCEREGLTISEVNSLPTRLEWRISECACRRNRETKFAIGTKPYEAAMPKKSMAQQMAELLVQDRDAGLTALTEKSGYRVDELKRIWQEWLNTEYGEKPVVELALDFATIVMEHDL